MLCKIVFLGLLLTTPVDSQTESPTKDSSTTKIGTSSPPPPPSKETAPQPKSKTVPPPRQAGETTGPKRCLAIVGTSDLHGHIEPTKIRGGQAILRRGGLLALSGYIDILRSEFNNRVLLVDAGDIYHGTLMSNESRGRAMIEGLNTLGFHAAAIGNHEFDFGPRLSGDTADIFGTIKDRIGEANFPFLSVNVMDDTTGKLVKWKNVRPSKLVNIEGIRVGIIGASTQSTATTTKRANVVGLNFPSPVAAIIKEAQKLRAQGAELVIIIGHIGTNCGKYTNAEDTSKCDENSELQSILNQLPPKTIDIALGGHTHKLVAHWLKGVATLQSSSKAKHIVWMKACIGPNGGLDKENSEISTPQLTCIDTWENGTCQSSKQPSLVIPATFLGKNISINSELFKQMKPFIVQANQRSSSLIGIELTKDLSRQSKANEENLGSIVAESIRQSVNADIALQNRGGVRRDLSKGALTYGEAYQTLPFDNTVVTMALTGAQLQAMVDTLYKRKYKLPYVAGVSLKKELGKIHIVHPDSSLLQPTRLYLVATNDYLATGGDGLQTILDNIPQSSIKFTEHQLLAGFIGYLQKLFPSNHRQEKSTKTPKKNLLPSEHGGHKETSPESTPVAGH